MTARQAARARARKRSYGKQSSGPRRIILGAVVALLAVGVVYLVMAAREDALQRTARPEPPAGTQTFEIATKDHTQAPVEYEQTPPVGGPHNPVWQNCGFYERPIVSEHAVHSLEHGAVWITYRPEIGESEINRLRSMAQQSFVLVSPWAEPDAMPSPIVASAWGVQYQAETAGDPDLDQFVRAFRMHPGAPEPGAACSGGTSQTL